jgi:hypothetical protein
MFISHVEGAAAAERGMDECGYHADVRFQIIKHNSNGELDSGAGDFVRSLTHTYASGDASRNIGWGLLQFATCEVCLLLFLFISAKKLNSFT